MEIPPNRVLVASEHYTNVWIDGSSGKLNSGFGLRGGFEDDAAGEASSSLMWR